MRKQFRRKIERRKAIEGVTTRHDDKGYVPKRIRKGKDETDRQAQMSSGSLSKSRQS